MLLVVAVLTWLLVSRLRNRVPDRIRIAKWAAKNGVEILCAERRWVLTGPYWLYSWPVVYRIRVRDGLGSERRGWLCLEAPFYGISMEVRWS